MTNLSVLEMKQHNLVVKMTSKFVVIVVPVITFLFELSLANFTYSKYAKQQVGTKTLIGKISTESKIACGIACKTTENCVGFWHNHTVFENHRKRSHSTLRAKRATFTF